MRLNVVGSTDYDSYLKKVSPNALFRYNIIQIVCAQMTSAVFDEYIYACRITFPQSVSIVAVY